MKVIGTMKNSRNICVGIAAVLAIGFVDSSAWAEEGVVRVKGSYGLASYSSPTVNGDIAATYPTLGLGVTYIWPSYVFADFSTRTTGSGASYNANSVTGGTVTSDQPLSRTESTLTVGMPTDAGIQVNAGIFTANTVMKLAQYGEFSRKMSGLTAGVGKGFAIYDGKSGTIGFNGAVALLNAKNVDRYGSASNANLSFGLSIGAVYNYPLNRNFSISADAKYQSYFIKYAAFSGDERILSAALSIIGQF
jgi:hypothetical protein